MVDYLTFEDNGEYRVVFKTGAMIGSIEIIYSILEKALESGKDSVILEIDKVEEIDWFFLQLAVSFARTLFKRGRKLQIKTHEPDSLSYFCATAGFEHLVSVNGEMFTFNEGC